MSACHTLKYSDFKIPSQLHAKYTHIVQLTVDLYDVCVNQY